MKELEFDSLSDEQFNIFLKSLGESKARARRVSLEELEQEFADKAEFLLNNDLYEFTELELVEFVETLFERRYMERGNVMIPFEEVQSYEYRLWLSQTLRNRGLQKDEGGVLEEVAGAAKIDYSGYRMWRYNPIVLCKDGKSVFHRLVLKDDDDIFLFLENRKFAIMSPVTYVGRTNSYKNARYLYAFAIDLDGVSVREVRMFLRGMSTGVYPVANIVVNSGHGLHVYYLLKTPIEMYATRIELLNKLKSGLTRMVWLVSKLDTPQVQSVVQGFRLPGTMTKFGKKIRAFWNREAPLHTPEELNSYIGKYKLNEDEIARINERIAHNPARVTLKEAEKMWPEWYAARVIGKKRVSKQWNVNRSVYDWWLNKLREGSEVSVHHRYWCVLTLVIYAVKCGISREEVLNDALSLVPAFDRLSDTVDNPFSADDVYDAMRAYDEEYNKWPIRVIESTTGIRIERNKRNGRDQKVHLRRIRALQESDYPDGAWREGNGRKDKSEIVRHWQENHIGCNNQSLCARETGLTRPTVKKWWNVEMATSRDI